MSTSEHERVVQLEKALANIILCAEAPQNPLSSANIARLARIALEERTP